MAVELKSHSYFDRTPTPTPTPTMAGHQSESIAYVTDLFGKNSCSISDL